LLCKSRWGGGRAFGAAAARPNAYDAGFACVERGGSLPDYPKHRDICSYSALAGAGVHCC